MTVYNGYSFDLFGKSDDEIHALVYNVGPEMELARTEVCHSRREVFDALHALIDGIDSSWVLDKYKDRNITTLNQLKRSHRYTPAIAAQLDILIERKRSARKQAKWEAGTAPAEEYGPYDYGIAHPS